MVLPKHRTGDEWPPGEAADWRSLYDVEDPDSVATFLSKRPELEQVLRRVPREISAHFGQNLRPLLDVVVEPDDEPASEFVVISIPTSYAYEDARARLRRLDDEWWLDVLPSTGGDIVIMLKWL